MFAASLAGNKVHNIASADKRKKGIEEEPFGSSSV